MPMLRVTMSELDTFDCIRLGKGDADDSLPIRLNPPLDVGLVVLVSPWPNSDWCFPLVLEFFSEAKCQKRVFSEGYGLGLKSSSASVCISEKACILLFSGDGMM